MARILTRAAIPAALLMALVAGNPRAGLSETVHDQPAAAPLVVGSGDLLDVTMLDSPELSGHFRVDQKGDVVMPLLQPVHVAGLTAEQVSDLIVKQYVQAQVLTADASRPTVFIAEYASQGISVTGEVKTPGIYPAFGVRTLNDVVTAAGGLLPTAASTAIITHRNDTQHPITVAYNPESRAGATGETQVLPGDTVMVPRAGIIYVLGNVTKAGGFVLDGHDQLTVEKAMALAGGQGHAAALNRTQLVRTFPDGRKAMITVPLDKIYKGRAADIALRDGDILYVPTSNGKLATIQAVTSAIGIGSAVAIYKTAYQ